MTKQTYAFVYLKGDHEAAIRDLDRTRFVPGGKLVTVEKANRESRGQEEVSVVDTAAIQNPPPLTTVFVGGFDPKAVSRTTLWKVMAEYGDVQNLDMHMAMHL